MPDPTPKPRPRPVDALFGDAPAPTYIVEAPQPVTTVAPPPVDPHRAPAPTASATTAPPAPPLPATTTTTNAAPSPESFFAPLRALPNASRLSLTPAEEEYFAALPETIRKLYDEIETALADSPGVAVRCMKWLKQAREAFQAGDWASAEFYVESVRARISASARSSSAARRPVVWLLLAWFLGMLATGIFVVAITYVVNLTLFGVLINPAFSILLRAMSWGLLGGVIGAMGSMFKSIQAREYDPASDLNYFARPLLGALIGAVLFLLSQANILAGSGAPPELRADEIPTGPVLLYLFAALAGFRQEYVLESFDNLLRGVFRISKSPRRESPDE